MTNVKGIVRTPESPHYHPTSKKTIWITTAGSTSRPGVPGQDITNYKSSISKAFELCQYCDCTPSPSKFPKPPGSMTPPLLKWQKSALLNKSSESDCAPSAQALPQPKSSGDQNAPQPKASADQNVSQHQKATFEVAKRFMEAIVSTKTPWRILSDDKYSMVEEAWRLTIEDKDCQRALAGAPAGTLSVCQLPSGPSLIIDPQTREAVSVGLSLMLLYQIYDIDYMPNYT